MTHSIEVIDFQKIRDSYLPLRIFECFFDLAAARRTGVLLVQEEDGNFHSVKETARERISALSQLIAEVSETMPDGVPAAKLRLAVDLLDDLPRLINREKQNGTPV